jgi:glycosyltransferase involved in cell wall biosynthesis
MDRKLRVLVVGQTPPPYGGQAVIIENLVNASYDGIEMHHVRMQFSERLSEVSKFSPGKLGHLIVLVARVLWARLRTGATVLYYPPSGPSRLPVLRDLVVLPSIRWAFGATVFHFHAGGISEYYETLPRPLRFMARRAYFHPDLAVSSSELNPPDAAFVGAKQSAVIPLGIPDHATDGFDPSARGTGPATILYVGFLAEAKGLLVLLAAVGELRRRGVDFELRLMGEFESPGFRESFYACARDLDVEARLTHLGVLTGREKYQAFADADIFCFPSHFHSETFGVVLLEAMQFELPVVATRWRGIPSVVEEGGTALLVHIKDSAALADALARLIEDPSLRRALGAAGRRRYLERYEETHFTVAMEAALLAVSDRRRPEA